MPDSSGNKTEGLTRREALKRGAVLSGALLWATPIVQSIGMSRVLAEETSHNNCQTYCVKFEFTGTDDDDLTGIWVELGMGSRNCLSCPEGVNNPAGFPDSLFDGFEISGDRKDVIWVSYPKSCTLTELEGSGDPIAPYSAAAKCGNDDCRRVGASAEDRDHADFNRVKLQVCDLDDPHAISHIELLVRCCSTVG